ncbi:hypothetical protein L2E82_02912 [Cichorium intybus]|uniref:Uncharacterized protein n=1 Tax=Cichorium intybus TaxID=13427 RepID=A0ACB9H439_CICIN|nr:hypothetical protein L2E82_02912 [Cichorium intybus]
MLTSYYKSIGSSTHTVMAKIIGTVVFNSLFLTLLLCFSWAQISYSSKPAEDARKNYITFTKCQVCEDLAHKLYEKQNKLSPTKISEKDIIEISKNVCKLKEQGDKSEPAEQDSEGQCDSECKAIKRTCDEAIGPDVTHVAEYIYQNKHQLSSLIERLCKGLSATCNYLKTPREKKNKSNDLTHKIMGGIMDVGDAMTKGIVGGGKAIANGARKMTSRMKKWLKTSESDKDL